MLMELVDRGPPPEQRRRGGGQVPKYGFDILEVGGKPGAFKGLADMSEAERIRTALSQYQTRARRKHRTITEVDEKTGKLTLLVWRVL